MDHQGEELSKGEIKKKAYLAAMRLKSTGHDAETIYARLEKQGVPEDLAREVVRDLMVQKRRDVVDQTSPVYNLALIRIGLGVIVALISILVFPDIHILPIGIIAGGIVSALLAKKKMNE